MSLQSSVSLKNDPKDEAPDSTFGRNRSVRRPHAEAKTPAKDKAEQ